MLLLILIFRWSSTLVGESMNYMPSPKFLWLKILELTLSLSAEHSRANKDVPTSTLHQKKEIKVKSNTGW